MPARSKKERKVERKRDKQKRAAAKEKRRQLRAAESRDQDLFADPAESEFASWSSADDRHASDNNTPKENPQIVQWWDRYMDSDGGGRIDMVQEKLRSELDEEWREAVFPESVFEAERKSKPADYVALLESSADEMRALWGASLSEDLDMRSYLDGIPRPSLDRHLASLLGFMALDRFRAPATLITVDYFVDFL